MTSAHGMSPQEGCGTTAACMGALRPCALSRVRPHTADADRGQIASVRVSRHAGDVLFCRKSSGCQLVR